MSNIQLSCRDDKNPGNSTIIFRVKYFINCMMSQDPKGIPLMDSYRCVQAPLINFNNLINCLKKRHGTAKSGLSHNVYGIHDINFCKLTSKSHVFKLTKPFFRGLILFY